MTFDALLVHTVTIVTPTSTTDGYGETTTDFGAAAIRTRTAARLVLRTSNETRDGRDAVSTVWTCYLPADVVVTAYDRIEHDTWGVFEIVGAPKPAVRRSSAVHHQELALRQVKG